MTESRAAAAADGWAASERRTWPADAGQLAAIRAQVHRWLAPLDLPDDTEHDLVMAVNEAATNAIEHSYPPGAPAGGVETSFWLDAGCLHIAVVDRGTWREPPSGWRGRGFGLAMMRQLVESVTVEHDARGTRVLLRHPVST